MKKLFVAALVLGLIAAGAAQATRPHRYRRGAEAHASHRAANHHAGKSPRGVSSYGGNAWVGSSYKAPKYSGRRKGF